MRERRQRGRNRRLIQSSNSEMDNGDNEIDDIETDNGSRYSRLANRNSEIETPSQELNVDNLQHETELEGPVEPTNEENNNEEEEWVEFIVHV